MNSNTIGQLALVGVMSVWTASPLAAEGLATTSASFASPDAPSQLEAREWKSSLTAGFGGITSSAVGAGGASYDLNWGFVELGFGPLRSSLKVMSFEWDRPDQFPGGAAGDDPWRRLYELNIGWTHTGMISERALYEVVVGAVSAFEKETSGSYAGYAAAYAMYALDSSWTFAAGALYSKHRRVSTQFDLVPIVGIMWNQHVTSGPSFAIGFPSTDITWNFSEKTTMSLEISSIEGGVYRLADDSAVRQEGYVEFRSTTATLRFDTATQRGLGLHLGVSHALDREIRLYDHQGGNRSRYSVEKNVGFTASVSWSFGS